MNDVELLNVWNNTLVKIKVLIIKMEAAWFYVMFWTIYRFSLMKDNLFEIIIQFIFICNSRNNYWSTVNACTEEWHGAYASILYRTRIQIVRFVWEDCWKERMAEYNSVF